MNASTIPVCLPVGSSASSTKPFVRHATTVVRVLFGLMFAVFGLNGFFNFIPPPATLPPEGAMAFVVALMKTGYLMPLIKGTDLSEQSKKINDLNFQPDGTRPTLRSYPGFA
jgi:hypothetical protein